jgi:hypothetical protein
MNKLEKSHTFKERKITKTEKIRKRRINQIACILKFMVLINTRNRVYIKETPKIVLELSN